MKICSMLAALVLLSFVHPGVSAALFGPGAIMPIPNATVPLAPRMMHATIHCDGGKTIIVQELSRTETGEVSRTIAISTMAGNTYMLGTIGSTVMTRRKTAGGEFADVHIDLWESHISAESPNYFLKTGGKPNDCTVIKKE